MVTEVTDDSRGYQDGSKDNNTSNRWYQHLVSIYSIFIKESI
jgi:hypothetical protein